MKKPTITKTLAKKKALVSEKKEGKLSPAKYKKHEKGESESYEGMESGGEKAEHRMPDGRMMKGKKHG